MYAQMNQTKEQNKIMQVNVQSVIGYRLSYNRQSLFGNVMINLPNSNYLLVLLILLFKKIL